MRAPKDTDIPEAHRIDPQMRRQLATLRDSLGPRGFLSVADLKERRRLYDRLGMSVTAPTEQPEVVRSDVVLDSGSTVRARIYQPAEDRCEGGLLYIHGGGMVMGSIEAEDAYAARLASGTGATTISIDYRLAPEHPYPAAIDDCTAALTWLMGSGHTLGIDPDRVAVYGVSGGGGLAAALALRWRHRRDPPIALLALAAPMLDDRTGEQGTQPALGVWDSEHNIEAWRHILGDTAGGTEVPADAAASRATDLTGMPPTFLDVGSLDLFLPENLRFAQGLATAGVSLELHVHPGAYHGFDQLAPGAERTRQAWARRIEALRRALRRDPTLP
ncbi:alpha/beta hydrolase [Rhodococcus wratislaviensis]|uniref:Putative arylesterase n=2 Tax=Rhodococcus wratislaviensis TaxID=44752 RepID=X0RGL5_RHOWR|nr:alpha/beta hydrolase [Rhodococcus wratislaviensis]GAF50210.1 putative arylesterase [Rhodococcus wratislaviensis NBRC 100605]